MKLLFIPILIILNLSGFSQDIIAKFYETPDYAEFKGFIDSKYAITMDLYPGNGLIFGKYVYDKMNKPLLLNGSIMYAHRNINGQSFKVAKIKLHEYGNLDTCSAIFQGEIINDSIFSGDWTNKLNKDILPFRFTRSNIETSINRNKYHLEVQVDSHVFSYNLSSEFGFKPEIEFINYIKQDNKFYILVKAKHLSKNVDRGNCGGGEEKYIIFLTYDIKSKHKSQQLIFGESCLSSRAVSYFKDNNRSYLGAFNFKDFSKYQIEIKDFHNSERIIYELDSQDINGGFRLVTRQKI